MEKRGFNFFPKEKNPGVQYLFELGCQFPFHFYQAYELDFEQH